MEAAFPASCVSIPAEELPWQPQVLPVASSPAVSISPTHRRSKPGYFSCKSIKAGVQVKVATAAQQRALVPVEGSQVLLCYPIQDGYGAVISWGRLLHCRGSCRARLSQAGLRVPVLLQRR